MTLKNSHFYSGTSGLVLPIPQSLYPEQFKGKSRLTYYASLFNSVEINSSFYKMPRAVTVNNWALNVGGDFRFTFKLSKLVTHSRHLQFSASDITVFMDTLGGIGNKRGCILIQLPPSLKIDSLPELLNLIKILRQHKDCNNWKIAVEFRNVSWYNKEVYNVLDADEVAIVIHDLPASATPVTELRSTFRYLRFHGPGGRYRGSYTDEFLNEYAGYIKTWMKEEKTVFVYFNNTMGDAVNNLQTLNKLVQN